MKSIELAERHAFAARAMAAIGTTSHFDWRLATYDIQCAQAHLEMLRDQSILSGTDYSTLRNGLIQLRKLVDDGAIDPANSGEDVHTALEQILHNIVGDVAGKLAMARARNDVAVTALKLWLRDEIDELVAKVTALLRCLSAQAERHAKTIMPGFSHLQFAQPITFGHLCLGYAETFLRDLERLRFARDSLRESPLGAGALAGTSFPIDRYATASSLGFDAPTANSINSVGERGFAIDFLAAGATLSLNLSRLAAEIVYWSSQPLGFVWLPDELVSTSAAMPHKRNPDAAELVRAKAGRIVGNLHRLQMVIKGLPLSYFRDLQEDKEALFDTADSLHLSLDAATALVDLMEPQRDVMARMASLGFVTSSDLADWICKNRGIPFRQAHHLVAQLVRAAEHRGCTVGELPENLRIDLDPRLSGDDWPSFDAEESVRSRNSFGGTAPDQVSQAVEQFGQRLDALQANYAPSSRFKQNA